MELSIRAFLLYIFPSFQWNIRIFENAFISFAEAILAFLLFFVFLKILQKIFLRIFRKVQERKENLGGVFLSIVGSVKPPFYLFLSFYFALQYLTFSAFVKKVIDAILLIWIVYQIVYAIHIFFDFIIRRKLVKDSVKEGKHTAEVLSMVARITLWVVGFLFVLSNMGVQITSLLAGLGIGGIAVAFAMQSILSDIFSSFAIYFDKPFKVGDWIMIGTDEGTVEKIGIKTTRIKSVNGEQLIISNKELTSARVQNYEGITERRVLLNLNIGYETKPDVLRKIPLLLKEAIESTGKARFWRAYLKKFADSSLAFEIVYYSKEGKYPAYAEVQNEVNSVILEKMQKEKIHIPYPINIVEITNNKNITI